MSDAGIITIKMPTCECGKPYMISSTTRVVNGEFTRLREVWYASCGHKIKHENGALVSDTGCPATKEPHENSSTQTLP